MPFKKVNMSLSQEVTQKIDKIAEDLGLPKSCIVNIAIGKPKKFEQLVKLSDKKEEDEDEDDDIL